jgi:flagellar basal-body rod protein FlgC
MIRNPIEGLFGSLKISSSGLMAQRRKINAISENIANIHTTKTEEGGPYRRKMIRFREIMKKSTLKPSNQNRLQMETSKSGHLNDEDAPNSGSFSGVRAEETRDESPPILIYDPDHPDAGESGFVELPNINMVTEMVDLITAQRAYEANVTALKASKAMAQKALEI